MRVLVIPGTNLVAAEVIRSLSLQKNVELHGAGYDEARGKSLGYKTFSFISTLHEDSIDEVASLIREIQADFLVLTHDDWLLHFAYIEKIESATLIKSSTKSILVSSYKKTTYEQLIDLARVPKIYSNSSKIENFPVFVKPNRGQGSKDSLIVYDSDQLKQVLARNASNFLICEYIPGPEFTVDCFSDFNHEIKYVATRQRADYQEGIAKQTWHCATSETISRWAAEFSQCLGIKGAWFFQYKLDKDETPVLLELGMRIAGASGINRLRGVNLSLLNLYIFSKETSQITLHPQENLARVDFQHGIDLNFRFDAIYVDLDDTLFVRGVPNKNLLHFIRNFKNSVKSIILITRNPNPLTQLRSETIILELFSTVIIVPLEARKSSYIKSASPFLFIDDSHKEREEVKSVFKEMVLVLDPTFSWQGKD